MLWIQWRHTCSKVLTRRQFIQADRFLPKSGGTSAGGMTFVAMRPLLLKKGTKLSKRLQASVCPESLDTPDFLCSISNLFCCSYAEVTCIWGFHELQSTCKHKRLDQEEKHQADVISPLERSLRQLSVRTWVLRTRTERYFCWTSPKELLSRVRVDASKMANKT